nr:MAG TPA: hypothetical protein [Caudoviricetes sp.]
MDLKEFIIFLDEQMEESIEKLDKELGLVFYPCPNAIEEALDKSMA